MDQVSEMFQVFKSEFMKDSFEICCSIITELKVLLTEFRSLPPLFEETPNAADELTIARDIYEHAVFLRVKMKDLDAFERDFLQLKPYYVDARNRIPPSPEEYPILGLNLLSLLVQNRIAEFHTELELLSPTALNDPCINYVVELEQSFTEGAYNRVLSVPQTVPHVTYVNFMDLLLEAAREEIAGCIEKAYDYLFLEDALQMLSFSYPQELCEFIEAKHPEWGLFIHSAAVYFKANNSAPSIPSLQPIKQMLRYARELEKIV